MPKMNPEIKEKWITALTSGEYKQGKGYMRVGDANGGYKYCCLGVLTDLCMKEDPAFDTFRYNTHSQTLCTHVRDWAGLSEADPFVQLKGGDPDRVMLISVFNDRKGVTFDEIAETIKENF